MGDHTIPGHDWNGVIFPGEWSAGPKAAAALQARAGDMRREGASLLSEAGALDGLMAHSGWLERRELQKRKAKLLARGRKLLRQAEALLQLRLPLPEERK